MIRCTRTTLFGGAFLVFAALASHAGNVVNTKHNLSATGPGTVRAAGETGVCIFCHAPHNTSSVTPLWNRTLPQLVYTPYFSSTLQATTGQPTNASKLCLSCHDGTIALGAVLNRDTPIAVSGDLSERTNLTTDLSDDHPISFDFDSSLAAADGELVDPVLLNGPVRLDFQGQMQCTTCHDPHTDENPKFLVVDNAYSALCVTCHQKAGWDGASHANEVATWNSLGPDPWPHTEFATVAENGCENCHSPHLAGSPDRLLNYLFEEDNCLTCHNGNVATSDVETEIQKVNRHPVDLYQGIHDPTEAYDTMARHVECQDCHNPHAANNATATAPNASGRLAGVSGVAIDGAVVEPVDFLYEVCFKCHADNPNVTPPNLQRQIYQPNIRMKFNPANPSFHPVAAPGRNGNVPSLRTPYTEASMIYCTDCHASNNGPGAGGGAPAGPHGSTWPYLLERRYSTADFRREESNLYAMCYKCHSRDSILEDDSFGEHERHLDSADAPCSVCHDPHGISATQGNEINNAHLINFRTDIVQPNPNNGRLEYESLGFRTGRCTLRCHGELHDNRVYPR